MFRDRTEAGRRLALELEEHRSENPLVLAIPRGGVEVGIQVAEHLDAPLELLVVRKLPLPGNPEAGFGAVAEDGSTFLYPGAARRIPRREMQRVKSRQREEIRRRIETLREGRPLPDISGRTVILVDDGLAMGSTMRAAIELCRNRGAARIVVGVPVSGARTASDIEDLADRLHVVEIPPYFRAVAQVYRNWYDVSDSEVLDLMDRWRSGRESPSRD
ncbi:MAG: phosphoribosyltransferase family protein [Candidatus Fermentibacteraceae bacterium]